MSQLNVSDSFDVELLRHYRDHLSLSYPQLVERVAAVAPKALPEIVAVSKGQPVEAVVAAALLGLVEIGENYSQELEAKQRLLQGLPAGQRVDVRWHFIGQIQSNKVRRIARYVSMWHSVDRVKTAAEIAKRCPGASVLVQVNLSPDPRKGGCRFDSLSSLIERVGELDLEVAGLMGVGVEGDVWASAAGFAALRSAVDDHGLGHCSMGMTSDFELAVREGSTMLRIGSALFGPRQSHAVPDEGA